MKTIIINFLLVISTGLCYGQILYGDDSSGQYHQFFRNGGGAAVYINQVSGNSEPILRLSSGTSTPNGNVKFTVENNGFVGIGTTSPQAHLHIDSESEADVKFQLGTGTGSGGPLTIMGRLNGETDISTYFKGGFIAYQRSSPDNVRSLNIGANEWSDSWNGGSRISLWTSPVSQGNGWGPAQERLRIDRDGNVGIGTTTPTSLLSVAGTMDAREIKVEVEAGSTPDYVFDDNYELSTLEETASYIQENHHLPEIPSATEMEANGMKVGEMNLLLLKKIEELTLHMIEMKKEIETLKSKE